MEHKNLTLETDRNLINKTLDDINMRYILLFLYVIRNDLFQDLMDDQLLSNYERVLQLDDIYKSNVEKFWDKNFIEIAVDLGLFKNIRSVREYEQKEQDFILKLGMETVTIEGGTILVPIDLLFLMINKKFNSITRRNFNMAITRLKGVSCETTSIIHHFIYEIGQNDVTLSNDIYYILDQFGNIYQAIKIEITIEGFYERFTEILQNIEEYLEIFDSSLNTKSVETKISKAIEEDHDVLKYLKDEGVKLSDKFSLDETDKEAQIFKDWYSMLLKLLHHRFKMKKFDEDLVELKNYYSGKDKIYSYLEFIEKVSFNEDNIINIIQEKLVDLRSKIVDINEEVSEISKKDVKLLNLDYERFMIVNSEE